MMSSKPRDVVLELVVDDSYALSEVVARLRATSKLAPNEARKLARSSIEELLRGGMVRLTRLDLPGEAEVDMNAAEAIAALTDDLSWVNAKTWRSHVRVTATDAGRKEYYARADG